MNDTRSPDIPPLEARLRRLERRLLLVVVAFLGYVALSVIVLLHDARTSRQAFWTHWLAAREFFIFLPTEPLPVSGGIAPAIDGRSIALWLSSGTPLSSGAPASSQQQIRLSLDDRGHERLSFTDRFGHVRISMAVAADGTPSIQLLAPDGRVTWSAGAP